MYNFWSLSVTLSHCLCCFYGPYSLLFIVIFAEYNVNEWLCIICVCSSNKSSCRTLSQLRDFIDKRRSLSSLCRHWTLHHVQETFTTTLFRGSQRLYMSGISPLLVSILLINIHFLCHNLTPIAYTYLTTDCCLSVLQACSKKHKSPRITRAVDNIIAEVQLPTTTTNTTFDSFSQLNTEQISQIVNEHHQRHGCVICLSISNEI